MIITLDDRTNTRLQTWSRVTKQPPEVLVNEAIEKSLDDWEDYIDAQRICEEIDTGRMKVHTLSEVERQLDELNAMEGLVFRQGRRAIAFT